MARLHLKVIVNHGEAIFKHVRGFEELAGLDVILAHRLLKNSIEEPDYVLVTQAFWDASGGIPDATPAWRTEEAEGIGPVSVGVLAANVPSVEAQSHRPLSRPGGIVELVRLTVAGLWARLSRRGRVFLHLPA